MPKSRAFSASVVTCSADSGSSMPWLRSVVGTLWSTTASVLAGARPPAPRVAEAFEGLRARHLVHEVAVDIEQAGSVREAIDDVVVPDLVVKRARLRHLVLGHVSGTRSLADRAGPGKPRPAAAGG